MLLRCSRYTEIRRDLFDRVRKCCPRIDLLNDENKFMYLLNSSGSTIKDVARFFHSAYEPHLEKTGFLHMRKQRRRSASR